MQQKIDRRSERCNSCANKNERNSFYNKHHTEETKEKLRIANSGKNSGNWQNGLSNFPYPLEFNNQLKEKIRNRDNHTCQGKYCSITEEEHLIIYGQVLHIHHIDYNKQNCNENNLITLCNQCNARANFNRNYWKEYFINKNKSLYNVT